MTTTRTANTPAPSFKFFEGNASESRTKAQVTVRRGGLMVITQAAAELLGDGATHVQLAYDAETRAIGIRSSAPDASGCYTLRTQAKSPSRLVGGGRFFKHHGLETDKATTFDAVDFGNGIMGFVLPAETTIETPAEKPARKSKAA